MERRLLHRISETVSTLLLNVDAFSRLPLDRWRKFKGWNRHRFQSAFERAQDLIRRDRDLVNSDADSIVQSVGDSRNYRQQRTLSRLFGPVGPFRVIRLDENRFDRRRLQRRGAFVFGDRRIFVQARLSENLLFHQDLAQGHVDAPLHLSLDEQRIEGPAAIVRDPNLLNFYFGCLRITGKLHDGRRVTVGWSGSDSGSFEVRRVFGRAVAARGAESPVLRLRLFDAGRKTDGPLRIASTADLSLGHLQIICGHFENFAGNFDENLLQLAAGLNRRVAGHDRDPARVAAEIDRRQIRIRRHDSNLRRIDAELFRDCIDQDGIGSLPDVDGTAKNRDPSAAIQPDLHAGVRHLIPVNGKAGAADVGARGEADAAAVWKFAEFFLPFRPGRDFFDAFSQADGADPEAVHSDRVGLDQLFESEIDRIDAQLVGDLVQLDFKRKARLRRAVPPLRAAGRLVGEKPNAFEFIGGKLVGHGLQRARIIDGRQPVAAVTAAIEK